MFQASSSALSWIGSLQGFFLVSVGALTGPLYDAGYFRTLTIIGSLMIVFGTMMLSLSHKYWQVFLARHAARVLGAGSRLPASVVRKLLIRK